MPVLDHTLIEFLPHAPVPGGHTDVMPSRHLSIGQTYDDRLGSTYVERADDVQYSHYFPPKLQTVRGGRMSFAALHSGNNPARPQSSSLGSDRRPCPSRKTLTNDRSRTRA